MSGLGELARDVERFVVSLSAPLARVGEAFSLSSFERDVLALCAAVEIDGEMAARYADLSFALVLAGLEHGHWSAVASAGPLRRWSLVELGDGPSLVRRPLRINERVLHALLGIDTVDPSIAAWLDPLPDVAIADLPARHRETAEAVARRWVAHDQGTTLLPVVMLLGDDEVSTRAVAGAAASLVGVRLWCATAQTLPSNTPEAACFARLVEREAVLGRLALLVLDDGSNTPLSPSTTRLAATAACPVMIAGQRRWPTGSRPDVVVSVAPPSTAERALSWRRALGGDVGAFDGVVDDVADAFELSGSALTSAAEDAVAEWRRGVPPTAALSGAARLAVRGALDGLAQRVESGATWGDLVLPAAQLRMLHELVAQVRTRRVLRDEWGFGRGGERALAVTALFSGPSGTGKSLAAEVIANELGRDLYRIDLAAVVDKYIGETEKNLRTLFAAAERCSAVLLFDEADALFGRRSEVHDAHDRYANIEVSYLLQRMETYRGLAILTTNLVDNIDDAFVRRLRAVVTFPFPDVAAREAIWKRSLPPATPTDGLDARTLSSLNVTGANIASIAVGAAALAADEGAPVRVDHIVRSAHTEYAKLGRPLTASETRALTGAAR